MADVHHVRFVARLIKKLVNRCIANNNANKILK